MTLDDDLLMEAKQRAAMGGVTVSVVINAALRRGLADSAADRRVASPTVVYGADQPGLSAEDYRRRLADVEAEDLADGAGL